MSKGSKEKIGRNPLEKLNMRQSSKHLQSEPELHPKDEFTILKKVREMKIQIDWSQLFDQAVPSPIKKFTRKFLPPLS